RVAPTVGDGRARWRALLARHADRSRLAALADAMPPAGRSTPTSSSGPIRMPTAALAVRRFLDAVVDSLMRSGAYPGTARGWAHDLAEALRGEEDGFQVRTARDQTLPERVAAW